jgi:hypothetical protein
MFVAGNNSNNNNVVTIDEEDDKGTRYRCEFSTSLAPEPEVVKGFYAPKVNVTQIHEKEKDILSGAMIGLLRSILVNKRVIIGLGPGRCGTMSLAVFLAAQPTVMSHHESNPKLKWDASIFEFVGKWADLFYNLEYPLPILSDVAFWYLPFVDYIKYVCPSTKFVCLRRDKDEIVESFMLKYVDTSAWTDRNSKHWRTEWVGGNTFLDSFPSYDLPKKEGCKRYVDEYYDKAEELEQKYYEDFKIFDIDALNTDNGKRAILEHCGVEKDMMRIEGLFKTNRTGEEHVRLQRIWKDRFGEDS